MKAGRGIYDCGDLSVTMFSMAVRSKNWYKKPGKTKPENGIVNFIVVKQLNYSLRFDSVSIIAC